MRPAEIKKRAMDPLYSERLLEEALSDISENAHARKLQHVEPHPGRGTTTRRAAFHFVTYKILQDFPNEGARLSADRDSKIVQIFLNAIIKRLFFAKSCHAGFSEGFSRPNRRFAPAVRSHPGRRTALKRSSFAGCALRYVLQR